MLGGQAVATRITGDPTNNGLFYLHGDHLGFTSLLTYGSSPGNMVPGSETRYLPYGTHRLAPTTQLTERDYTGQKENLELGLLYYNARFYVPGIGRFASADTIVPDPANPQSFNRYSYVLNNSLRFIDPTGHYECAANGICMDTMASTGRPARPAARPTQSMLAFTGGDWSDAAKDTIRQAANALSQAMADAYNELWSLMEADFVPLTAAQVFNSVMGGTVTFNRSNNACAEGCWGSAAGRTVTVYTNAYNNNGEARFAGNFSGVQWAIHEMGHLFEGRVNGILGTNHVRNSLSEHADYTTLLSRGLDNDIQAYGFAGTRYGWQQSPENTPGEIFADMVIGWTYGQWADNPRGDARSQFMNTNMPGWISLVVNQP